MEQKEAFEKFYLITWRDIIDGPRDALRFIQGIKISLGMDDKHILKYVKEMKDAGIMMFEELNYIEDILVV